MSIDLKGNTNYVALKNLQEQYIVPRTNLAAIDMTVSNGLEVNGNNIGTKSATAAELMNGVTNGSVLTPKTVANALSMGQASILDMHTHTILPVNGAIEWSFNGNQIDITGTASSTTSGIAFLGPVSGPATKTGKFLMTFDVFVPSTAVSTNFSVTGPTTMTAVSTYPVSTTTKGSWVRIAILINTTSAVYTGNINFLVTVANGGAVAFSLANGRLIDVTDLSDSDIVYMVTAGQYNETVVGETVIKEGNPTQLYKPGYGIKIKGDTIEIDTSVLAVDASDYIYGVDMDLNWADATSARIGGGIKRVVMDRTNGLISEVADFDYMPAHEGWRRCVMDDLENRHVNYYLDKNDSNLKEDHSPAVLTGEDGDVMVEWPITYVRVDQYTDSNSHAHQRWLVSLTEFDGSHIHDAFYVSPDGKTAQIQYVGAFRMGVDDTQGNHLYTDENLATQGDSTNPLSYNVYKGRSIAGVKPVGGSYTWRNGTTNTAVYWTIQTFREKADNNGGHIISSAHQQFLALMMMIEYGTDIQYAFNNGFTRSSGLGWFQYRLTGRTAVFGNGSTPVTAINSMDPADDQAGMIQLNFAQTTDYSSSTFAARRIDKDVNVGRITYDSLDYFRDSSKDVGYQINVGNSTLNRTNPFEHVNEGVTYYGWTDGINTYYTIDHSPTTASVLYSDVFGDVSSAVITGVSDLYAWYNASGNPHTTVYTKVENPTQDANVGIFDIDNGSISNAYKGIDAYAWCPNKATTTFLYTKTARPVANDKLYTTSSFGTEAKTITSVSGNYSSPANGIIQCSYRGIEDPFGVQWCFEDGAWGVFTMVFNNKTYYRASNDAGGTTVGGTKYYKWYTDIAGQLGEDGADVVYVASLTPAANDAVYTYNGSSMSSTGTITSVTAPSCGAFWMTTSTDAYAVVTAIKLSNVVYWRNGGSDQTVNNIKYYGWKSNAGTFVYTTTRQATTSTTAYTISGTTATSAGTIAAVYNAHQTYLGNYDLAVTGLPTANNWVRRVEPHTLVPLVTSSDAGEHKWFCDYFYNVNAETTSYPNPRVVLRGGHLNTGGSDGPFYLYLCNGFSITYWNYGSRLAV